MVIMIRTVIGIVGFFTAIVSAILFVQRQERSAAYLILTQQRTPSAFLSQQLRRPDGRVYQHLPPDFGLFAAWSPDGDVIFHQQTDGLYVYDTAQKRNRLVVGTPTQTQLPLTPNNLWQMMYLSPDGTGYLFLTETSVYHFDTRGSGVHEIFHSPTSGVYAAWEDDGQWANVSYVDVDQAMRRQRIKVHDPAQNEPPEKEFQVSTPFGRIESARLSWRLYPNYFEETIELQLPDSRYYVSRWLTEDFILVSEQVADEIPGLRNDYLMNLHTQELNLFQPAIAGSAYAATMYGNNLYIYYMMTRGFDLYEIPMDRDTPRLIIGNCTKAMVFDHETGRSKEWQGESVETIFLAVEEQGIQSIHRYEFGKRTTELLYTTPAVASRAYIDISPDYRSLIVNYQDLARGTGYRYHLLQVNLEDGQINEVTQDHTVSGVSPLIDRTVNVELLALAGIVLSGIGLIRRR